MDSPAPFHRWQLRDVPQLYVFVVWVAFGASVIFYLGDWPLVLRGAPTKPQSQNVDRSNDDDMLYTGSIIFVPERGERCSVLGIDNRTGKIWEKGFINCYDFVTQSAAQKKFEGISGARLRAINGGFHTGTD
jgi:hypothetical protein